MPANTHWKAPLDQLHGVGPKVAEKLQKLGLHHVADILFHLPLRYQDKTHCVAIGTIQAGQEYLIRGQVLHSEVVFRGRRMLLCQISDGTGQISLRFFHFNPSQQAAFKRDMWVQCFGEVRYGQKGLEMVHPEYQIKTAIDDIPATEKTLTPIYPSTEGINQRTLRQLTDQVIQMLDNALLEDLVPEPVRKTLQLMPLSQSLRYVHRPPADAVVNDLLNAKHPAQKRLAFDELLAHQLAVRSKRSERVQQTAWIVQQSSELQQRCIALLPFKLTKAQIRVVEQINQDLQQAQPALRLIQGDVGSGKTIVALLSALPLIEVGLQVAIMAPTELLAEQHRQKFEEWLTPLEIPVACLLGSTKSRERQTLLQALAHGELPVIVGTHALFQESVLFKSLALVIIDEQHRFGVGQRLALFNKGVDNPTKAPHQITLTATPIPRSLAMTAYADMDYSVIDELPPGRMPIKTVVIAEDKRTEVMQRIQYACQQDKQVYWVCPLIEESELLQCQAAEKTHEILTEALTALNIGLVHGRMKAKEKATVMHRFKQAEYHVLVATTVIEVGVDVPNASLMIIENAERLGLAQLHQLRGRVGRGQTESSCVLMYRAPLSQKARKRLNVMRETQDGFKIAQYDLEMRGAGELFGTRQTGETGFKIADVIRDADLLPGVHSTAEYLETQYSQNCQRLINRWLGYKQQFHNT